MSAEGNRVSAEWLALREPADAAARATDLVQRLAPDLPATDSLVIHDLGCGTGAMARWLAPLLPRPQHWVVHDRDPDLLAIATANPPGPAAGGAPVTVEARQSDITRLHRRDLAGATLITASALLDLLTEDELTRLIAVSLDVGCPMLLTLSVLGRVELSPAEPLDGDIAAAFDAHQQRATERGRLLGRDAVAVARDEFGRIGAEVVARPSPWRLGATETELAAEWLAGWVAPARKQQNELAAEADAYRHRRLAQAAAGVLEVRVDHADLLVLPGRRRALSGQSVSKRDESA